MNYWEKILEGFSFKSKGGAPDFTNPNDRMLLRMELLKKGWNEGAVNEFLHEVDLVRKKQDDGSFGSAYAVQKFNPDRGQKLVKRNASKDDIKSVEKDKKEKTKVDKSKTKAEPQPKPEKNKDLKQDIDFNNPPDSIQKDIEPSDEDFDAQEDITPHEYDPDEIEINGKKIKLPVTEEVLNEEIFNQPPYKFPKKYIKALARIMNTQKINENNPPITSFTDSSDERETVGAGQISAQASEMLMLMSTSLPDDQSEKLYDLLEKVSNSTQGRQILDKDWIQSSRAMRDSALKNIREEHGDDAVVEFAAWDSPADFEDGLGINNHKKDKGFSTDTAFRVKKPDGTSVLSEVSNKKSLDVHLANPGAMKTERKMKENGTKIEDERSANKVTENMKKRADDRLKSISQDEISSLQKIANMSEEEQIQYFSKLPPSIRRSMLIGSPPKFKGLKSEAKLFVKMANVPLPWDTSNVQFLKAAAQAGVPFGKKAGGSAKDVSKATIFMNYMLYADELNKENKKGKAMEFIHNQVGIIGKEPFPKGSQRDVENHFIENLNKNPDVAFETIRRAFPLQTLMSGEESMALGSMRMSKQVCLELFGTDDYNKIEENLSIRKNEKGEYYLVYSVEVDGGVKEFEIAHLKARGKGKGYSALTFEMSMAEQFKHEVYCANMKSKPDEDKFTDKEKLAFDKLIRKYGECKV